MKKQLRLSILALSILSPVLAQAADQILRVAIFPFETDTKSENPAIKDFIQKALNEAMQKGEKSQALGLGDKITDLLQAHLTGSPAMQLVERAKIDKAFDELALGKTGLVDDATAARVGHIVGAQVLVTGRAFPLDDELFIVGKVIGVETSRVFAAKTSVSLSGKLSPR